ncbi:hypothetical protein EVAR_86157_1 [Eumeta japonica]|uniref:Uncharacterized protein n=1 Tax=Eumeta variegata TaxID=151549 RepID=A0A4C1YYT0_EUMVA|nr:hypothetical protein EVAR_86157_1 [Eumeta japonica]
MRSDMGIEVPKPDQTRVDQKTAVHVDASLTQVGERQMSNADERGGRLCLFVARSALSLALQALNGTPQSEAISHSRRSGRRRPGRRSAGPVIVGGAVCNSENDGRNSDLSRRLS